MRSTPSNATLRLFLALGLVCGGSAVVHGQERTGSTASPVAPEYLRAMAIHYGVGLAEVRVLASWELEPDEIPVVLHLASRGGISPDVVVAYRSDGRPWSKVARDVASGGSHLKLALNGPVPGELRRAHELFLGPPGDEWSSLTDREVVALVNASFLGTLLGVSCQPILDARSRAGTFSGAYAELTSRF